MNNKVKLTVEKNSLLKNYRILQNKTKTEIFPVIKANGYGLGTLFFAETAVEAGAGTLCVTRIEDAVMLRENGIDDSTKIIILNCYRMSDELNLAVKYSLVPSVDSHDALLIYHNLCKAAGKECIFQIAADTGMGRFGFSSADDILSALESIECGEIDGIYSHFSASFEKKNKITKLQFEKFKNIISSLENQGIRIKTKHIANSNAAVRFPEYRLDAVRLGSALLGRIPEAKRLKLEKAGYLQSEIINIKTLPAGHNIGYGNIYTTKKETRTAVIELGYSDGFHMTKTPDGTRFSDKLAALKKAVASFFKNTAQYAEINGKKAKILGRVMVNHVICDVTGIDCNIGDAVKFDINPILINGLVTREYK